MFLKTVYAGIVHRMGFVTAYIEYTEDEETGEESDIHFIVSSDFIEGMREAAKEIYEKSK